MKWNLRPPGKLKIGLAIVPPAFETMTARGAADFLTRSTSILGGIFIVLSILMAAIAGVTHETPKIDTSLASKRPAQNSQPAQTPAAPLPGAQPQQNDATPAVPLAQ